MRETLKTMMRGVDDIAPGTKPKLIANNTVRYTRANGDAVWRLHHTDIAVRHADGSFTLNSGGWRSVTTKARLNKLTPARISQRRGVWYVGVGNVPLAVPFRDNMRVDANGKPIVYDHVWRNILDCRATDANATELRGRINAFVRTVDDCSELPLPNGDDCWACSMFDRDPSAPHANVDHLLVHMTEGYLHGSLIVNAMRWAGYSDINISTHYQLNIRDTVKRTLRRYLARRLGLAS